ncbi:hypothetical protein [Mesorhizobium sp. YM1C-6-2]|uniref:hypothetical protein n=1 Tax=Mesorhizobium sp. YM1C-6-2 TaxID=1827501 RepID=UPI000EF1930B|nr:hypothetical protein [Mesorhizobium sp. YM1C-6-2]RLP22257.1 hypothetical protein D8676_25290 [Mesorhizobium sp. YM1C-6-2]
MAAKKTAPKTAANPAPSQAKADDIRAEAATTVADPAPKADEKPAKAKAPAATSDAPYPSQADLDAMKAGTYRNREMKSV